MTFMLLSLFSCHSSKKSTEVNNKYTERENIDILKPNSHDNTNLYNEVKKWLGTPYRYGGHDKDGADCSGLVMEIYQRVYHVNLERNSSAMLERNCKEIEKNQLREGDLIFFTTDANRARVNHVGLYLKEGKFVHSSSSKGVIISDLNERYYKEHYFKAARVIIN